MKISLLSLVILFLIQFSLPVFADGDVCFIGEGNGAKNKIENFDSLLLNLYLEEGLQCKDLQPYLTALDAVDFTLYVTSAGLACTGAGATVSLVVLGVGAAFRGLNFVVKNLRCESDVSEKDIEKRVEDKMCRSLAKNGVDCVVHLK